MATRFEASEGRLNQAALAHLCNASAVFPDAQAVPVIFDNAFSLGGVGISGMGGSQPMITLATSSAPLEPVGVSVVVRGISYLVAAHEPDGTGFSRLLLESA